MATKPRANPMRKPKTPTTRTPISRGQNRTATSDAKYNTAMKLMDKAFDSDGALADSRKQKHGGLYKGRKLKAWGLLGEGTKANKESRRIKEAGSRMARAQAASKAKRGK